MIAINEFISRKQLRPVLAEVVLRDMLFSFSIMNWGAVERTAHRDEAYLEEEFEHSLRCAQEEFCGLEWTKEAIKFAELVSEVRSMRTTWYGDHPVSRGYWEAGVPDDNLDTPLGATTSREIQVRGRGGRWEPLKSWALKREDAIVSRLLGMPS